MNWSERLLLGGVLTLLVGLSVWLQFGFLEGEPPAPGEASRNDPDYYIENFTAVGMDEEGKRRYVLEAERLVHYPDDNTSLLDYPHIIQYEPGQMPRHTYADSGWMSGDGNEVLLTGNVRVLQGGGEGGPGGVQTSDRMRILLGDSTD